MPKKNSLHSALMDSLIHKHQLIADLINKRNVFYLDVPVYNNIGDLLIMLGTLKFFDRYNITVKEISSYINFSNKNISPEDVIVLQGGGNFGDLYPILQQFREMVVRNYPDNKIIILPQTIYFESKQNYQRCCEVFSKHNDLHIFTRDEASYKLALPMSKHVYLAPDMAHQLYPITLTNKRNKKVLLVSRKDKEASIYNLDIKPDTTTDWDEVLGVHNIFIRIFAKIFKAISYFRLNFLFHCLLPRLWIEYSRVLVDRAIKLFSEYEIIITNRLHGHILACLMDKKNIVYDNSYGKISSYIKLWTKESNLVDLREKNKYKEV